MARITFSPRRLKQPSRTNDRDLMVRSLKLLSGSPDVVKQRLIQGASACLSLFSGNEKMPALRAGILFVFE